jgi:hypothetical protein
VFFRPKANEPPSSANFIAVKADKPNIVYQALLKKGFIVRPVEMEGYLRVSVGTKGRLVLILGIVTPSIFRKRLKLGVHLFDISVLKCCNHIMLLN